VNVAFDEFVCCPLLWLCVRPLSPRLFHRATTALIEWTTYIVVGPPTAWCGLRVYVNDMEYFQDTVKRSNCLLLSNHGSRIDWLIGMFVGLVQRPIRVGFVCEALIKWLPFIGWYRNWVCEDIFVRRSFKQDERAIRKRIQEFRDTGTKLMLFLSPEGMIVDRNKLGQLYTENCKKFCRDQGYPEFDYVLTPRYKGITVLAEHLRAFDGIDGKCVSVCMCFVRDGVLLSERLDSPHRVIPDLYTTFAGVGGSAVKVHIHIRDLDFRDASPEDIKRLLMEDYAEKDKLIRSLHETGHYAGSQGKMTEFEVPFVKYNVMILLHNLSVVATFYALGVLDWLFKYMGGLLLILCFSNSVGKCIYGQTMESIPFETAIKSLMQLMYERNMKKSEKKGD